MKGPHDSHETGDDEIHVRHAHEEGHGDGGHGEPWLVSYADMMTLLFGFFVIMYAFAVAKNEDDPNMIKIRRELAAYFGGKYIDPSEKMNESIKKFLDVNPDLKKSIEVTSTPDGLKIMITSQLLFQSGKADLGDEARTLIGKIVQRVADEGKHFQIRVEGYTDDNPVVKSVEFESNWDLSSARAISVLRVFEEAGFRPDQLQATGFGEGRPLLPNRDAKGVPITENQSKNRRVVIRVLPDFVSPAASPAPKK
jgi:chemotaxis protein MotB